MVQLKYEEEGFTTKSYDEMIVHIPPGDGEGVQNPFQLNVANILWPNNIYDGPWWSLNVQYEEPKIESVAPALGPAQGFEVVLSGQNFGPSTNPSLPIVRVGNNGEYNCTISQRDHKSVTCYISKGVGKDLDLSILVNGQEHTLGRSISYEPPKVTEVLPARVHTNGGDVVTVNGLNFGVVQSDMILRTTTNNHPDVQNIVVPIANIKLWTDVSIQFVMPAGLGTSFGVQIIAGGQNSNIDQTVGYMQPSISNITLAGGRKECTAMIRNEDCGAPTSGGFLVEIIGSDFSTKQLMDNANPTLFEIILDTVPVEKMGWCGDGQKIGCVEEHNHNVLRLYMPAGTGTQNDISIRIGNQLNTNDATAGTNLFSYDAPWINTITPREGNAGSIGNADGNVIKLQGYVC